ncbi:hemerythrin domain-containing protein [Streptomyces sp. NPDC020141]|uniref:hemerythrin domain-containing protein n=1 Tax=Streptomyces sp. NPDC020141 TaxID=3365065 RepID=UPI0037B57D0D
MTRRKTGGRGRDPYARSGSGPAPTPAPKKRHSAKRALQESTRPTAPAAARNAGADRRGRDEARHLIDVHDHYRRELTQVRDLLRQVRKGSATVPQARGRLNALALATADGGFSEICRAHCRSLTEHHRMEDRSVFPHLRRSGRDLQPVLDRLEAEHRVIHTLLTEVDRALIHLARNPGDHAPVTAAIDLLTDTVLSHFAYEERELLGPLARYGFSRGRRG